MVNQYKRKIRRFDCAVKIVILDDELEFSKEKIFYMIAKFFPLAKIYLKMIYHLYRWPFLTLICRKLTD